MKSLANKIWGLKRPAGVIVLIALLAFSVAKLTSASVFRLNAGDLKVDIGPYGKGGKLIFDLGPVGELSADTHDGPLDIVTSFVPAKSTKSFPKLEEFQDIRLAFFLSKVPWLFTLSIAAGLLFALGRSRRVKIKAVTGMLVVVLGGSAALGIYTARTFRSEALSNPQYNGPVEGASRVIEIFNDLQNEKRFAKLSGNINRVVAGLQRLHEQIVASPAGVSDENSVKFVVVSDMHSNPLGWVIANEIVDKFDAVAVLDAGDLTTQGEAYDAELFKLFGALGVPHVIAPGNHENTEALERIGAHGNVSILENGNSDVVQIAGIKILGDADPLAHSDNTTPDESAVERRCNRVLRRYKAEKPHLLLVHNNLLGECVADYAEEQEIPLVFISGHNHKQALGTNGSVVHVNPGTSGADGFTAEQNYGFAVLSFDKATKELEYVVLESYRGPNNPRQHDIIFP